MRKLFITIVLMFCMAGVANALPTTLTDVTGFGATSTNPVEDLDRYGWGDVNKLDGLLDYVAWTHHFDLGDYTSIYNGTLTVSLVDNENDRWNRWGMPILRTFELGFGYAEDGNWDIGEVDTGDYSYSVAATFLEDGEFSVKLVSLGGDFFIDSSTLTVNYDSAPAPAPVPEPATILLVGMGLLGIAGAKKKFIS